MLCQTFNPPGGTTAGLDQLWKQCFASFFRKHAVIIIVMLRIKECMFPICLNTVENECSKCFNFISAKISEIVGTRCRFVKLKCTTFGWASATGPAGDLTAVPRTS